MRRYPLHLALVALLAVALPASSATLTWYTNRAAWEAAVGNTFNLIDFQSGTIGNYGTSAGVTVADVQFTGKNNNGWWLYLTNNDTPLDKYLYCMGAATGTKDNVYVTATFNIGTTYKAVGIDIASPFASFYMRPDVATGWGSAYSSGFVGFVSDAAVNQIRFTTESSSAVNYNLDNFVFSNGPASQPEETPDLDTLILCGTGLTILSFLMRRHKRAKA